MSGQVYFVNRFHWPDEPATAQLLSELTAALAARGMKLAVITARSARHVTLAAETRHGVAITRIPTTHWGRCSLLGRGCDFAIFHLLAGWQLVRKLRRGDTVIAMTDPPLLGITVWLAASLRRARLFHWSQDIYPEIAATISGRRSLLALRPLRDLAWRRAAGCVVPGRQMAAVVRQAGVPDSKIMVLPNWAPGGLQPAPPTEVAALRAEWGLGPDQFVIGYSGNLGRVHDLFPLLDVAAQLEPERRIVFAFVGEGPQRAGLERATAARQLGNVRFLPPQPLSRLAVSLSAADVHLVTLRPGCEPYVYPSKLYGAAAVGRPVLVLATPGSELAATVIQGGFGQSFARGETAAIAGAIVRLAHDPATCHSYGRAAEEFARGGLSRAVQTWSGLLASSSLGFPPAPPVTSPP